VDRYNSLIGTLEARILPTARKLNAMDESGLLTPAAVEVTPRSLAAPELQQDDQAA
jgi:DNA recombination protein RmuC